MKTIVTIFSLTLLLAFSVETSAQLKLPSTEDLTKAASMLSTTPDAEFTTDILKALAPDQSLALNANEIVKLTSNNKSYVDSILKVVAGTGDDTEKMNLITKLTGERKDFISKLLGEGKAAKYYELVKEKVKPLVTKYALAKVFM